MGRLRDLAVAVAVAAVTIPTACAPIDEAGDDGATGAGRIVFSRGNGLYTVAPDGSDLTLLAESASYPRVSPDGRRIAFLRAGAVWTMQRDGSAPHRLIAPPASDPAWSHDGARIYFVRYGATPEDDSAIASARASDGSDERPLTHGCVATPAPSPRGDVVAYGRFSDCKHGFDGSIRAVSPDGSSAELPFELETDSRDPDWSPDGGRLTYVSIVNNDETGDSGYAVYVSADDGSPTRAVAPLEPPAAGANYEDPAWSPAGDWIALVRTTWTTSADGTAIWVVRPDGTDLHAVTEGTTDDDPVWLPAPVEPGTGTAGS